MNKFLRLFVVAFAGLVASASAFTTVQPRSMSTVAPKAPALPTSTSLGIVDPAIVEPAIVEPVIAAVTAPSNPIGAVIMMMGLVSAWEINTSGRAKKE